MAEVIRVRVPSDLRHLDWPHLIASAGIDMLSIDFKKRRHLSVASSEG